MGDSKNQAERMAGSVEITHEACQYLNDGGLWTVIEVRKIQLAKTACRGSALSLIERLKSARPTTRPGGSDA